ncbi:MAG TPA: multidrug effflux MFS transporter [Hyphomonadaceae bacterium]|nr:multidrug effflux MFS transporter [Hyphomonadaceae bacterium]HPI48112.1 multidrug effflux MFS transporter [Hyphomonadaceae bacterium]
MAPDSTSQSVSTPPTRRLPLWEFVGLTAMLMALNALAIDIMLPALPQMGADFAVREENDRQLIIVAYMLGFGVSQLFYGPLTDRFGRRSVLFVSLFFYVVAAIMCVYAPTFDLLIAARAFMGASAGGSRVIAVSAARDLYAGRQMAKVMSLVMIVFMSAPIVAPFFGQLMLKVMTWHGIFWALAVFGVVMFLWVLLRLPETLPKERRVPLNLPTMFRNYVKVIKTREALGYTIASGFLFGGLMSYISASEQLYHEVYDTGDWFALWFAGAAIAMSVSNLINSRLVERLGMRLISHAALIAFVIISVVHAVIASQGPVPFPLFYTLVILAFFCIGFQGPNYNAIAMEPLGALAGSGAALIGFASSFVSASIGGLVARQFDGTVTPIFIGHAVVGSLALVTIFITERGKLMKPHHHADH